jgi:hypothetical protein
MYKHVSKCKNNKITKIKKKRKCPFFTENTAMMKREKENSQLLGAHIFVG